MEKMKQSPMGALESREVMFSKFSWRSFTFFSLNIFWRMVMIATYGFGLKENIPGG